MTDYSLVSPVATEWQCKHFGQTNLVIGADWIIKYVTYYLTALIMKVTKVHQLNY